MKPQKISFEIFWRLRWKYIPSFYQCFNQWQHSSAILIAALYCDGPPLWLVEKKVRRKETTWSLPKKFIADNSRTSSFEFLVSSTIMVGNKTHLKFQNITKIKLNFYRAKEYLFSIFIWNLEFLSQDHFSFFLLSGERLYGRSTNHNTALPSSALWFVESQKIWCSGKLGKVMVSTWLGLNTVWTVNVVINCRILVQNWCYWPFQFCLGTADHNGQ